MRGLSGVLIFVAVLLAPAPFAPLVHSDETSSAEVERLIAGLKSQDFKTRMHAAAELKQFGTEAMVAVKSAVHSRDVEVSRRCVGILEFWLRSEDRAVAAAADAALKELAASDNERIRCAARYARRDSPEQVISRLQEMGARFTYRQDRKVRGVDLSRQNVSNRDVASLHSFHEVESIDLDYTRVTSDVLKTFQNFSELRELRLRCCCLSDDHLQFLQPMSKLEVLHLWRTGISDQGLEHLASLEHLTELTLGYNDITDDGLKHLAGMKELTTLNLVMTDITDRGFKRLADLPKLKHLNVKSTNVTPEAVQWLQNQRPDLKIRCPREKGDCARNCRGRGSRPLRSTDSASPIRSD